MANALIPLQVQGLDLPGVYRAIDQEKLNKLKLLEAEEGQQGRAALRQFGGAAFGGDKAASANLWRQNPQAALDIHTARRQEQTGLLALSREQRETLKTEAPMIARALWAVKDQQGWDAARQALAAQGIDVAKMPPQFDPNVAAAYRNAAIDPDKALMNVPAGGTVYNRMTGQPVFTAPGKPEAPTLAQTSNNAEVLAARRRVLGTLQPQPGESLRAAIRRASTKQSDTGRENPDYDPFIDRDFRIAGQRMVGADPGFDEWNELLDARKPAPRPAAPAAATPQSGSTFGNVLDYVRRNFGSGGSQPAAKAQELPVVNGQIDASRLVAGTVYQVGSDRWFWNGTDFEPR